MNMFRLWRLFHRSGTRGTSGRTSALAIVAFASATAVFLTVLGGLHGFIWRASADHTFGCMIDSNKCAPGTYETWSKALAHADKLVATVGDGIGRPTSHSRHEHLFRRLCDARRIRQSATHRAVRGARRLGGRLAASRRDARLAALRLAGATTAQVTKLTVLDAGGQALLGALVGMAGYFALIPATMLLDFQNQHFTFEQLWVGTACSGGRDRRSHAACLVSALVALRRVAFTPLGVTQRTGQPMPSAWRALIFLAVLAVGYLLLNSVSAFAHLGQMVVYAIIFGVFFLGFAMVNVVGTWVVAMRARSRAKHPKDAATMIAMRRILDNPKRAWRNVSGVALAVFIAGMTSVCGLLATGIGGNHDPFDPSMLYMRDIAMGGFLTLAFAAVLAAVSSGVMQTSNVYDQADEYRMLALEGTDEATLDKARMMEVITPLNTVMAVSLGCSVLLLFPILATSLLNPVSLLTLAAGIGLCYALMVLGGCAGESCGARARSCRLPYGRLMASPRRSWIPRQGLARSAEQHRDDCDEDR